MVSKLFKVYSDVCYWVQHSINCPPNAVFEGGSVFPPGILDVKEEDIIAQFMVVCN